MCGIAGLVSYQEAPDAHVVETMSKRIEHRGPDDSGMESIDATCVLASRRLSILDIAGGHQPMWDERRRHCVVFNGEIYNHAELRERLVGLGHTFATDHSDTEMLVHGFEEWGPELFANLDGQFAIAFWDRDRKTLTLVRDRTGEKPLYVGRVPEGYVFGSEIKALLEHPGLARDIDPIAIEQYLAFDYAVAPRTVLRDVRKLRAGHFAVIDPEGLTETPYWKLRFSPQPISAEDAADRLDELLDRSVATRMVADVPVGLFLSGGLDSTSIGYYMSRHGSHIRAFTIGFEQRDYDESAQATAAARHLGLEHDLEILSEERVRDLLPRVTDILDEPMSDPSVFPTYLLSTFARRHVTVALGGDGSDELLMGYRTYQALKAASWLDPLPATMRSVYARAARRLPDRTNGIYGKGRRFVAGLDVPPEARLLSRLGAFGLNARSYLADGLRPALTKAVEREPIAEIEASFSGAVDWGDRTVGTYIRSYLQEDILAKVDRASMAASLEVRAPFLMPDLIDFLATVPSAVKFPGMTRKNLLRRVMRGRIPDSVIDRPKQGFGAPLDAWFRGGLAQFARESLDPDRVRAAGLLDPESATRLLEDHLSGAADHGRRLWAIVQLQLWHDRWVNAVAATAA
jgi:asparagine synthase (glutamine-hydrolysing)